MDKPSPSEVAQLRAEMRRRKILERGDERMRKLFKESKDETTNPLVRGESVEDRNRNLMEEIIKDPNLIKTTTSSPPLPNSTNCTSEDTINEQVNVTNEQLVQDKEEVTKPLIDLSYFEKIEKKQKLKQDKLELSRFQLLVINLINMMTMKKDVILINLFKGLFACLCSYFSLNIVTPFIISQSIAIFYTNLINKPDDGAQVVNTFNFKLSYAFIKSTLFDSLSFVFCYTITQTFLLN